MLRVRGQSENLSNRAARHCCSWFLRDVIEPAVLRELKVELKFVDLEQETKHELQKALEEEAPDGRVKALEREVEAGGPAGWVITYHSDRPRRFWIVIDTGLSRAKTIRSIAHECWHIKQYVNGELREFIINDRASQGVEITLWKNKLAHVVSPINEDRGQIPYYKRPWEREARRMEWVLYKRYKESRSEG